VTTIVKSERGRSRAQCSRMGGGGEGKWGGRAELGGERKPIIREAGLRKLKTSVVKTAKPERRQGEWWVVSWDMKAGGNSKAYLQILYKSRGQNWQPELGGLHTQ